MTRRRVIGVDFSGARQAGDHIWIAVGTQETGRLTLESCRPARELPGGARDRHSALAALRAFLAAERRAAAGIAQVLRPLVEADAARVVPMRAPASGKVLLVETCPRIPSQAARSL
ncbi:MAG: hypothetical protein OXI64_01240 [Defluviicoccus sp.]|nr:hypothetical protein [Defluviicoccus sp.]